MKGTVFHGPHDVRVERVDDPALKTPTDALVRITRAGICGSDLHFYHGAFPIVPGFVLGHEGVGVIEEVGAGVVRLKKGDRVVVSGLVACGRCFFCRRGQPSQCAESGSAIFGYGANSAGKLGWLGGEQSEAVRVPMADYTCYPLPDAIDDDAAVFLADILPTAFFGALNGNIRPGDTVAIFGCGPVGLCAVMCAKLFGPAEVIAVDSIPYRLELARKLGATPVNRRSATTASGDSRSHRRTRRRRDYRGGRQRERADRRNNGRARRRHRLGNRRLRHAVVQFSDRLCVHAAISRFASALPTSTRTSRNWRA